MLTTVHKLVLNRFSFSSESLLEWRIKPKDLVCKVSYTINHRAKATHSDQELIRGCSCATCSDL